MASPISSNGIVRIQMVVLFLLIIYQLMFLPNFGDEFQRETDGDAPRRPCGDSVRSSSTQTIPPPLNVNLSMERSFGACLIMQDDNHLLAEWLAYHYHTLPLRRLIVGVDPRSITSPSAILHRYRQLGLMKISEWDELDMMPPHFLGLHAKVNESDSQALTDLYVSRQFNFYTKCMAVLKHEGMSWAALTDTDEFILPNFRADEMYRLDIPDKEANHTNTIFELLHENRRKHPMIHKGCVSMHRLQFGYKESSQTAVQAMVPNPFNGTDFATMRWRYHDELNKRSGKLPGKCMVNLNMARESDFVVDAVNSHRPIQRLCSNLYTYLQHHESPFSVYHYSGSWEQWNFRNDTRLKRQREFFDKLYYDDPKRQDDTIRPWLQEFVDSVGVDVATYLLEGAGKLEQIL